VRSVVLEEESCTTASPGVGAKTTTSFTRRHHRTTTSIPLNHNATMSALPRSIGSRLLAPALRPSAVRAIAPQYRSYSTPEPERKTTSDEAPAVKVKSDSTQIRKEGAAEGMRHQPDYNVAIDYRTSCVCKI
jgi:hypothetical protein